MRVRLPVILVVLVLLAAACSSEQSAAELAPSDAGSSDTTALNAAAPEGDEADQNDAAPSEDAAPSASGEGPTATVTLENGETFTFGILCGLEPQIAAGVPILFTVVSYDDPINLDVTQLGDASVDVDEVIADMLAGAASIGLYDSTTYDTVWEANTLYGGEVELELNGNTVTGHGIFIEGGELGNPGVAGELVANC
ncbi:MAG: hypothetical protein U9R47_04040 [Actinomycetota bacterium]|nr:hypothetical protein [Actinomycetota bacterium]